MNDVNKKKILIVDDIDNVRQAIALNLGTAYQIEFADSGTQALELMKNQHIDLVITDVAMPMGNGIELVENIRELDYSPIIIILTGYVSLVPDTNLLETDFIMEKPCRRGELLEAVETRLGK